MAEMVRSKENQWGRKVKREPNLHLKGLLSASGPSFMPLLRAWDVDEPEILMRRPLAPFLVPKIKPQWRSRLLMSPNFCSGETMLGPCTAEPEPGMQAETGPLSRLSF